MGREGANCRTIPADRVSNGRSACILHEAGHSIPVWGKGVILTICDGRA